MAEHLPHFNPGAELTFTASAPITGGQLVAISGDRTVAPTSAASAAWIGVAGNDAANGGKVHVTNGNVHTLTASGAIAAGANVISAANGAVATIGAVTDYSQIVGVALSAAAGGKVLVKLARCADPSHL